MTAADAPHRAARPSCRRAVSAFSPKQPPESGALRHSLCCHCCSADVAHGARRNSGLANAFSGWAAAQVCSAPPVMLAVVPSTVARLAFVGTTLTCGVGTLTPMVAAQKRQRRLRGASARVVKR
eukprot:3358421-Rhodomonas_salina.2